MINEKYLKKSTSLILAFMLIGTIFGGLFAATDILVMEASAAGGSFGGGNGTAGNPYIIEDVDDLQNMSANLTAHYVLGNDINAGKSSKWNGGLGFEPIGRDTDNGTPTFQGTRFTGKLDGNGHSIYDLFINRTEEDFVGLFGYIGDGGIVTDAVLENSITAGRDNVGGLAGVNSGSLSFAASDSEVSGTNYIGAFVGQTTSTSDIQNCSSSGSVYGSGNQVGGLVGMNYDGVVSNSYSHASVDGTLHIGGLVGHNSGSALIYQCYSFGAVTGTGNGLVGDNEATVINSFWNTETSGQSSSAAGTAITTSEMMLQSTFSGWDFSVVGDGTLGAWIMAGYPHLQFEHTTEIKDEVDLQLISVNMSADYTIMNDIDAGETIEWNNGSGFDPLGTETSRFTGDIRGGYFTISDIYIDRPSEDLVGLISYIGSTGQVKNLTIISNRIVGNESTGILAGRNDGRTDNITVFGECIGGNNIGGLSGYVIGKVNDCNSYATVFGVSYVGGMIGYTYDGCEIENCSYYGSVDGYSNVGGIVGINYGELSGSINHGSVNGTVYIGGLAGYTMQNSYLNYSYNLHDITGNQIVGGLVGRAGGYINSSYNTGDVTIEDSWAGGIAGQTLSTCYINNSHSTGKVIAEFEYAGGLIGSNEGTITDSYSSGDAVAYLGGVGGFIGINADGTVKKCYSTGDVNTTDQYAGGFVGSNGGSTGGTIQDCYSTGDVYAYNSVGGFTGDNWRGDIENCYSTGHVSYDFDFQTGGFAGNVNVGSLSGNLFDNQTSGEDDSPGATGKYTVDMVTKSTFTAEGWDFDNTWFMVDGETRPFLRMEYDTSIRNSHQLQLMVMNTSADYSLEEDIDMSDIIEETQMWGTNSSSGEGFYPVGNSSSTFTGSLGGQGYRISNIWIDRPSQNNVGLFGRVGSGGNISNIELNDVEIWGRDYTGSFAGRNNGILNGLSSSGNVTGSQHYSGGIAGYNLHTINNSKNICELDASGLYTGGICGYNTDTGTVNNSENYGDLQSQSNDVGGIVGYNLGSVQHSANFGIISSTGGRVGGLVGSNSGEIEYSYNKAKVGCSLNLAGGVTGPNNGYINESYNQGSVSGDGSVGGIAGHNSAGAILNCYSSGYVEGNSDVGGLVGNWPGTVTNSFWDNQTSGQDSSAGGGAGRYTYLMKIETTFSNAGWDFTDVWGIKDTLTYPYLRSAYTTAPKVISGTAYMDRGITPAAGVELSLVSSGVNIATVSTGANGAYEITLDPSAVSSGDPLLFYFESGPRSNTLLLAESGDMTGLDIYGIDGTIRATSYSGASLGNGDFSDALEAFESPHILFNASGSDILLDSGVSLESSDALFRLKGQISSDAHISFGHEVWMEGNASLSAGSITFDSKLDGCYDLELSSTGDIAFDYFTGYEEVLGDMTIVNAREVLLTRPARLGSFIQESGDGNTSFDMIELGSGAGQAEIHTENVSGNIYAGSLSLDVERAFIDGEINGSAGEAGADEIIIMAPIRIGNCFFDGIDLYRFTPIDNLTAYEDEFYQTDYEPMDPANETLTWSYTTSAAWLNLGSDTGILNGTPGNADVGTYTVEITAHDGPDSVTREFTLTVINVNDPPTIDTGNVPTATEDQLYSVDYDASDIDPTADQLSWGLGTNASWLNIDTVSGVLSGTPGNGDVGGYWVNVSVGDGKGGLAWTNFSLDVGNQNDDPVISTAPVVAATEDQFYSVDYDAEDCDPTGDSLTWGLSSNAGWLVLDPTNGWLNGTPDNSDVGAYWVNVSIHDGNGGVDFQNFTLNVLNVNDPPAITTPDVISAVENQPYLSDYDASDDDPGPDALAWSLSTNASGLNIGPSNGTLYGTVTAIGSFWVNVTVVDGNGGLDWSNFTMEILADTDGDGIPDTQDDDDDNDGTTDANDDFPLDDTEDTDTDGDGTGDNADTDDDDDGTPDTNDDFPQDDTEDTDTDGDGIGDNADTDDDGDGTPDTSDEFPKDPTENIDTDGDGVGDNADTDDDDDGWNDTVEQVVGTDPLDNTSLPADMDGDSITDALDSDMDGDGYNNSEDAFPTDPTESVDIDGDGIGDNSDPYPNDMDNDGVPDTEDAYPLDPARSDPPVVNNTVYHNTTNNVTVGVSDADNDGDGWNDSVELLAGTDPLDPTDMPADSNGDGIADLMDIPEAEEPVTTTETPAWAWGAVIAAIVLGLLAGLLFMRQGKTALPLKEEKAENEIDMEDDADGEAGKNFKEER